MSEVVNIEDVQVSDATQSEQKTLAYSLSPLLKTMTIFGLYFRCPTNVADKTTTGKSRVQWNMHLIYSAVVVIILWINLLRMFSVFTKTFC